MHFRKSQLSCAILAILVPTVAAHAQDSNASLVIADGETVTIQNDTLQTSLDYTHVFHALNSGSITASSIDISTEGENSSAIVARTGGHIEIADSSISTRGTNSHGLDLEGAGSSVHAKNAQLGTRGWVASAVRAASGASVFLEDVSIKTQSGAAAAIYLQDADLHATGTDVLNSQSAGGIRAFGGSVVFERGSIQTIGSGIELLSSLNGTEPAATADLLETRIVAAQAGLAVYGSGSAAKLTSMNIIVIGDDSPNMKAGIFMMDATATANVSLYDSLIETHGATSHGIANLGGKAALHGSSIDTKGENSFGVLVNGFYGMSTVDAEGLAIQTASRGSLGAMVLEGDLSFNGGSITTMGDLAHGVLADGIAKKGNVTAVGMRIKTSGEAAHGMVAGAARLDLRDTQLIVSGADSQGLWMYGRTEAEQGSLLLSDNSWIDAQGASAIRLSGGSHELSISDSTVVGRQGIGNGILLLVEDVTDVLPLEQLLDPSSVAGPPVEVRRVQFEASASKLYGDVVVDSATADVHMVLGNGTTFSGALRNDSGYQVAQLALDGSSQWNVRASSSVGALEHAGTIAFDAPAADGFKTVTVSGDYVGNGGQWIFNRALGDDTSLGDQLVINGNSSGTANVSVRNAGGAGALTQEGIRLITVAGQSDAQFTLQGRAVAGAYDYFLFKGGVSTPDDGNWYLRSEYVPPVDPPEPPVDPPSPPEPPIDPPLPPEPPIDPPRPQVERPEPAAYLANRSAALGMFRHSLHDRAGDPAAVADASGDAMAWMHLRSAQPDSHDRNRQVQVDGQISSVLVGVGRRFEVGGTGELQAGAMLGHGRARNDSRSQVTGYTARGVVTGTSVGAYATWLQDARMQGGAYVDGWLQYGRFRNSVQGEGLQKERYDARNWSASAEAGYVLPLRRTAQRGIYLEPQLQVVHSRYDSDRVVEVNGTVVEDRGGGETSTRLGLRLYSRGLSAAQGQVHPYVAVNWWSGGNGAGLAMDGERLQRQLPRDIYEAKAGVQVDLSGGWRGWGELSRQSGGMGFRDVSAQVGVSYSW